MSTTTETVALPTGTYNADTVHSSVGFEVAYASAGIFSGSVNTFQAQLADGVLSGSAEIASLVTKDENLQAHLLSPEFFDAEQYPEVGFVATQGRRDGDRAQFDGEITIKGVTRPATLTGTIAGPVADAWGNERWILTLETTIDRTEFGITWNAPLPDGSKALADEVTLKANLALVKAA